MVDQSPTSRQVKVIGLHEDVGFSGGTCKDLNLYSRLILVEDVVTGRQFLVQRPRNLWVSTPYDRDGGFIMHHKVYVDFRTGGSTGVSLDIRIDAIKNTDGLMGSGVADQDVNVVHKFCSEQEHRFETGEPVEHWFEDIFGDKIIYQGAANKSDTINVGTTKIPTTTTSTPTTPLPGYSRVSATKCGFSFGDPSGMVCVNKPLSSDLTPNVTYQLAGLTCSESSSCCATINVGIDQPCTCDGCTYDVVNASSVGGCGNSVCNEGGGSGSTFTTTTTGAAGAGTTYWLGSCCDNGTQIVVVHLGSASSGEQVQPAIGDVWEVGMGQSPCSSVPGEGSHCVTIVNSAAPSSSAREIYYKRSNCSQGNCPGGSSRAQHDELPNYENFKEWEYGVRVDESTPTSGVSAPWRHQDINIIDSTAEIEKLTEIFSHADTENKIVHKLEAKPNRLQPEHKDNLYVHVVDCFCFTLHLTQDEAKSGQNPLFFEIGIEGGEGGIPARFHKMVLSPWKRAGWTTVPGADDATKINYGKDSLYREDYEGHS